MLLLIAVASVLSDREEVRVAKVVLVSGIGSVGNGVSFIRGVRGTGRLIGRLSHSLGIGVVSAVSVAAETGVLECMFSFGGVDVGLRRSVETNGLSLDDFGVGRWTRESLIGGVELERSQFTTFRVGEGELVRN